MNFSNITNGSGNGSGNGTIDDLVTEAAAALLVLPIVRSLLSFAGIVILIAGSWYVDRTWDEEGYEAYKSKWESLHPGVIYGTNPDDLELNEPDVDSPTVIISPQDLDAAFPFPWVFLLGWIALAAAYLFDTHEMTLLDPSIPNILCLVCCLIIAGVASVPMGDAVKNRKAKQKKYLGLAFVISWLCLAVFTGFDRDWKLRNGGISLGFCLGGAVTIIASMKILWKYRKMGDSWEKDYQPNPNPVVHNMGGPLFVLGWFLFWVGMAAKNTTDDRALWHVDCATAECGLPIFFNIRTLLAFFAGCGMVPIVVMLDNAHDAGGEYVGFGTDGASFGRFFETPVPFIIMWIVFGLAGFLTLDNTFDFWPLARTWVVFAICLVQGIVAGVLIQTALYEGEMKKKNMFSIGSVILFLGLAVNLGFLPDYKGLNAFGLAMTLGVLGAVFVIVGQTIVFGDRIRGDYFMQNGMHPNPRPVVYTWGLPIFMGGWIMLSIAMSLCY